MVGRRSVSLVRAVVSLRLPHAPLHARPRVRPAVCCLLFAVLAVSSLVVVLTAADPAARHDRGKAAANSPSPRARRTDEVRALWVARTTLTSPAAIARMIDRARSSGFNTLLVQVRGRGDAYYKSTIEPRAEALDKQPDEFDPLQVTLAQAHKAGLRVHAWICVNLVSSAVRLPSSPEHVIYQHPEWLMVPRSLARELRGVDPRSPVYLEKLTRALRQQSSEVEGLYLSPIEPEAATYQANVVRDIATRYAVDGVHLDYVRYPSAEFDYSESALASFADEVAEEASDSEVESLQAREESDPLAWTEAFPARWREFRRTRLTAMVKQMRAALKAARPNALLTAAVVPDANDAADGRLQDWGKWLEDKTLDVACPMAYGNDAPTFTKQLNNALRAAGDRPVWAGIGAYRISSAQTIYNIRTARRLGAAGIVLFSYDSLASPPATGRALTQIGKAVFGRNRSDLDEID